MVVANISLIFALLVKDTFIIYRQDNVIEAFAYFNRNNNSPPVKLKDAVDQGIPVFLTKNISVSNTTTTTTTNTDIFTFKVKYIF